MQSLALLIPISFLLLGIAGIAFCWAVKSKQFDSLETHALDVVDADNSKPTQPGGA